MVLTNFECWAHDGAAMGGASGMGLPLETMAPSRHVDPFNPRAIGMTAAAPQHVSSNCYYGFSYVNAAHELNNNNNNNNNINSQGNAQNHNNNGCIQNANGVNGMLHITTEQQQHNHNVQSGNLAAGGTPPTVARCKKRYFVSDDDYAHCEIGGSVSVGVLNVMAAKRCRYDDDGFAAAQYCNDFFSLPSTQIGTQSCLMDTEDCSQLAEPQYQQQQPHTTHLPSQVDEAMCTGGFETSSSLTSSASLHDITTTTTPSANTSNIHFATPHIQQQQLHQQQQQQQQAQTIEHSETVEQHAQNLPTTVAYQQQHNYQGHLHRANRDVSRCLVSHMI